MNIPRLIESLNRYKKGEAHLVFFCDCNDAVNEGGILFIPTKKVFEWLKGNKTYLEKLFVT